MGVKTNLAALSVSAAGKTACSAAGVDVAGQLEVCLRDLEMLILRLTPISAVLTAADSGDSNADASVVTAINTALTALS